jgi:hypothetical protein
VLSTNDSGGTYAVALASNGSVGNTTTMVTNWPDAIERISSGAIYIFYYDESATSATYFRSIQNTSSDLFIYYTTSPGAYAGKNNVTVEAASTGRGFRSAPAAGQLLGFYASSSGSGYSLTCGSNYSVAFTGATGSVPSLSGFKLLPSLTNCP